MSKSYELPQSPDEHDNDGIAIDALRAIFPKSWKYKSSREIFGGREYGDDLIIEIRDEQKNVTGIEFRVQNKVNPKIGKKYISVEGVKLSTLRRLVSMPTPALLHAYDENNNVSYWLWLHDWYVANHKPAWEKKKTISIRIPKTNTLDKQTVGIMEHKLTWEHQVQKTKTVADFLSKKQDDYEVRVFSTQNSITTIIDAQNSKAIPTVAPLDQETYKAIISVLERGEPVLISKGAFELSFSQDLSLIHEGSTSQFDQVLIFPVPQDESFPLKIEHLDENEEVVYQTNFVMMNLVNPGTVIRRWQGKPDDEPVLYTLTTDINHQTATLNVRLLPVSTRNANNLLKRLSITNPDNPVSKYRVTDLQLGTTKLFNIPQFIFQISSSDHNLLSELLEMIVSIESQLGIDIELPDKVTDHDYRNARLILSILKQGWVGVDIEKLAPPDMGPNVCVIGVDTAYAMREMLKDIDVNQTIYFYITRSEEYKIELFGQEISLGQARYEFPDSKIINPDNVKQYLSQENLSDDELVQVPFAIDRGQARIKFLDWPQSNP